jgi:hypothetical protein
MGRKTEKEKYKEGRNEIRKENIKIVSFHLLELSMDSNLESFPT